MNQVNRYWDNHREFTEKIENDKKGLLNEFIAEIEELKKCRYLYRCKTADLKNAQDELYNLMEQLYLRQSYEERAKDYRENACIHCRHYCDCKIELPQDIGKPIPFDENIHKGYTPYSKECEDYKNS